MLPPSREYGHEQAWRSQKRFLPPMHVTTRTDERPPETPRHVSATAAALNPRSCKDCPQTNTSTPAFFKSRIKGRFGLAVSWKRARLGGGADQLLATRFPQVAVRDRKDQPDEVCLARSHRPAGGGIPGAVMPGVGCMPAGPVLPTLLGRMPPLRWCRHAF